MNMPKISAMWDQYPIDEKSAVVNRVGGQILADFNGDPDYNTCCIRTCLALNYSSAPVDKDLCNHLKNRYVPTPHVRAHQGKDKLWYIASVYDMRIYLEARFGQPKRFKRMGKDDLAKLDTGAGILMFFAPHCDLWNGSELRYNNDEWTNGRVEQLLLWPCAPEDSPTKSPT